MEGMGGMGGMGGRRKKKDGGREEERKEEVRLAVAVGLRGRQGQGQGQGEASPRVARMMEQMRRAQAQTEASSTKAEVGSSMPSPPQDSKARVGNGGNVVTSMHPVEYRNYRYGPGVPPPPTPGEVLAAIKRDRSRRSNINVFAREAAAARKEAVEAAAREEILIQGVDPNDPMTGIIPFTIRAVAGESVVTDSHFLPPISRPAPGLVASLQSQFAEEEAAMDSQLALLQAQGTAIASGSHVRAVGAVEEVRNDGDEVRNDGDEVGNDGHGDDGHDDDDDDGHDEHGHGYGYEEREVWEEKGIVVPGATVEGDGREEVPVFVYALGRIQSAGLRNVAWSHTARACGYGVVFGRIPPHGSVGLPALVPSDQSPGPDAEGVVYHLARDDLAVLDVVEGLGSETSRVLVDVEDEDGVVTSAYTYLVAPSHFAPAHVAVPSSGGDMLDMLSARTVLSNDYVEWLTSFVHHPQDGGEEEDGGFGTSVLDGSGIGIAPPPEASGEFHPFSSSDEADDDEARLGAADEAESNAPIEVFDVEASI